MGNSLLKHFRFLGLDGVSDRWAAIRDYNAKILDRLPPGAKDYVCSDWHYDYGDPRCPHDSWVKSIELKTTDSKAVVQAVRLCLLGAFHDRDIYFDYEGILDFSIEGQLVIAGGRNLDWLYDEVHLCQSGSIEHVIEFEKAVIRIECSDLKYSSTLLTGLRGDWE